MCVFVRMYVGVCVRHGGGGAHWDEAPFTRGQLCVPLSPPQPPGEAAESFAQSYDVVMVC